MKQSDVLSPVRETQGVHTAACTVIWGALLREQKGVCALSLLGESIALQQRVCLRGQVYGLGRYKRWDLMRGSEVDQNGRKKRVVCGSAFDRTSFAARTAAEKRVSFIA